MPSRMEKARIAVCQFCFSSPKPDTDSQIVVTDYTQMDRILSQERTLMLAMCKRVKKTGCNVLLVQKSILRDALSDLALHYLAKLRIMVVADIERDEIEFISKTLGCRPIADIDSFSEEKLASADLAEEIHPGMIQISGIRSKKKTVSVLCRGANEAVLAEAQRSLHDALSVVRCLVHKPALICGGGAPESFLAHRLALHSRTLSGQMALCASAYASAFTSIPTILAENAGLNAVAIVTDLLNRHASGHYSAGVNVRRACVGDMIDERVFQPLLVSQSSIQLATETVAMVLKIDDIVQSR